MSAALSLAIPSKGRLRDQAFAFLTDCGLAVETGGGRGYTARLRGVSDVEVRLMSASEIATGLAAGETHMGVTGLDLIRELTGHAEEATTLLTGLGFGFADVVVAVPAAWIDVETMSDLEDVSAAFFRNRSQKLRVATKYVNLARRFFAEKGLTDYRIVESLGATEAAPAAGSAEAIVDITTTGATLAANNLKVLSDGMILSSEAHLAISRGADWSEATVAAARAVLDRIAARAHALAVKEIRFALPKRNPALVKQLSSEFGCSLPFGEGARGGEVLVHCPHERMYDVVRVLYDRGAQRVVATTADYIFEAENPLFRALRDALS
ncbi:MAG: ATP phosphoribosyltransferase [Pseudomonadota bacterium]